MTVYFDPKFIKNLKTNLHISDSTILRMNHPVQYALRQVENGTHPRIKKSDDGKALTFNFNQEQL